MTLIENNIYDDNNDNNAKNFNNCFYVFKMSL